MFWVERKMEWKGKERRISIECKDGILYPQTAKSRCIPGTNMHAGPGDPLVGVPRRRSEL